MGTQNPLLTSKSNGPATSGQIRDIRNQTEAALENGKFSHGELLAVHRSGIYPEEYQRFLRQLATRLMTPAFKLADVLTLLGRNYVVTQDQHVVTFKRPLPAEPVLCPSMEQIQECSKQNKAGTHKWVLGFASALSFREQYSILGADRNRQPNFYPGVDWFLKHKEKEWAESKPEAGYYLLDMTPRWNYTNWENQGSNITALGEDYERADERVFSQVVLAYQKTTGQRLFDNVWHWGRIPVSHGYRVCVRLLPDGFSVFNERPSYSIFDDWFVCVALKSTHRALIA